MTIIVFNKKTDKKIILDKKLQYLSPQEQLCKF